jgi:SAM-dependent methyltransferase
MYNHEPINRWIENEGKKVLCEVGVTRDSIVLDFGCGYGYYSIAAALNNSGGGKVYAVDKDRKAIKAVNDKAEYYKLDNIVAVRTNGDLDLNFISEKVDVVLLYDIIHSSDPATKLPIRFDVINMAGRLLKKNGILSILPFHLSSFRDKNGKKKTYKYSTIIDEIVNEGFTYRDMMQDKGIHFEKVDSPYYLEKGNITFEDLERGTIINFIKE